MSSKQDETRPNPEGFTIGEITPADLDERGNWRPTGPVPGDEDYVEPAGAVGDELPEGEFKVVPLTIDDFDEDGNWPPRR